MKNRISKGFDFLAPVYDGLARLIIGDDIIISQLHFLSRFSECQHLLILGGGSGRFLEDLCKYNPDLKIDYIDLSPKMLEAARKRLCANHQINFIQGSEDDIPDHQYDGAITNFYLDMFTESALILIIEKIRNSLVHGAPWVVTDFVNHRKDHAYKLWCMYRFFRIITQIEATHLPDWQSHLRKASLVLTAHKRFNGGFIASNLYRSDHHLS